MLYKRTSHSSLIDLASQLYSPEDRHQYTKVILKKERMKAQLEIIQSSLHHQCQQYQLERQQKQQVKMKENRQQQPEITLPIKRKPSSTPTQPAMRHSMSSYSILLSKSASMYQPKLLEQYDSNNLSLKQIDMLSNQYNNSKNIEELLLKNISSPPSSSSSSPMSSIRSNTSCLFDYSSTATTPVLKVETSNLSDHHINQIQSHHLPLSPPLSPSMSSICLATSHSASLPDSPKSTSTSTSPQSSLTSPLPSILSSSHQKPSPPLLASSQLQETSIDAKKVSVDMSTPSISSSIPDTIQQYHDFATNNNTQAPFYYLSITHIQKNNGMRLRSFLGQPVLLNKAIRMEYQRVSHDPRFYQGKDETSGQVKVILKLVIIKSTEKKGGGQDNGNDHDHDDNAMAPFGIHFKNSAVPPTGHGGSTANLALHAWIPDSLVLEALHVWLLKYHLPPLLSACHVMRDGIKLYIVYNASAIY
ncbi:hypothetical protein BCR42DRAFT_424792 [Absidia repens]|uniref:Uncharacterized protein n=1 Tax=Absidia repens TaxID=90262 RepID=A0A1X2I3U6_9FUNG|nr:hypothetical protein BCR42DRAFT_424792 [Absidia repens]